MVFFNMTRKLKTNPCIERLSAHNTRENTLVKIHIQSNGDNYLLGILIGYQLLIRCTIRKSNRPLVRRKRPEIRKDFS